MSTRTPLRTRRREKENVLRQCPSDEPLQIILRSDDRLVGHRISVQESRRNLCGSLAGIPFHLESRERAIGLLYVIYLLLLRGAPKVGIHVSAVIMVVLHTLTDEEVLP